MKKGLNYLLATLLLGGLFTLHSCGGEDVPPVLVVTSLSSGFDASTDTFTGTEGDTLVMEISVEAEDVFNTLTITKSDGSSLLSEARTEDKQTSFSTSFSYVLTAAEIGKDVSLTITATDDNEGSDAVTIGIVTEKTPTAVKEYDAKLQLFAPDGDGKNKAFFSTDDGKTYSNADVVGTADPVSPKIDFGYFYGNTNKASLAAPASYPEAVFDIGAWGTKNATKLKVTGMATDHFAMIKTNDDILSHWAMSEMTDADGDAIDLKVGDIVGFELTADKGAKKGFILVTDIVGTFGSKDYIEISVVMQGEE